MEKIFRKSMGRLTERHSDKLCEFCGDGTFPDLIATCCDCKKASAHIYCMQNLLDHVPDVWYCEECEARSKLLMQPAARNATSKAEASKVKFLPAEEVALLTSRVKTKGSYIRRSVVSLPQNNEARTLASSISKKRSIGLPKTAESRDLQLDHTHSRPKPVVSRPLSIRSDSGLLRASKSTQQGHNGESPSPFVHKPSMSDKSTSRMTDDGSGFSTLQSGVGIPIRPIIVTEPEPNLHKDISRTAEGFGTAEMHALPSKHIRTVESEGDATIGPLCPNDIRGNIRLAEASDVDNLPPEPPLKRLTRTKEGLVVPCCMTIKSEMNATIGVTTVRESAPSSCKVLSRKNGGSVGLHSSPLMQVSTTKSNDNFQVPPVHANDDKGTKVMDKALACCKEEPVDESFDAELCHSTLKHIRPMGTQSSLLCASYNEREMVMDKTAVKDASSITCGGNLIKTEPIDTHLPEKGSRIFSNQLSLNALDTGGLGKNNAGNCMDVELKKPDFLETSQSPDSPLRLIDDMCSAHPIQEPHWRGEFHILESETYEGIQAHFSCTVALKAYEASKLMPERLKFDLVQRLDVWPRIFQVDPPACGDIALYFFPGDLGRFKEKYLRLLKQLDLHDLALQCCLGTIELLIFTSKQLPLSSQRLDSHMYLWGIFRRLKCRIVNQSRQDLLHSGFPVPPMVNSHVAPTYDSLPNLAVRSNPEVIDTEINMIRPNAINGRMDKPLPNPTARGRTVAHRSDVSSDEPPPGFSKPYVRYADRGKRYR